jgi:hypothetical protein
MITVEMTLAAHKRGWIMRGTYAAGDYSPDQIFWHPASGERKVFTKPGGKYREYVTHLEMLEVIPVDGAPAAPLPTVDPTERHAPLAAPQLLTVGDLRNLLGPFHKDTPLAEVGLAPETMAAVAKLLALAPPLHRQQAATTRISRGFWEANSAEALGL